MLPWLCGNKHLVNIWVLVTFYYLHKINLTDCYFFNDAPPFEGILVLHQSLVSGVISQKWKVHVVLPMYTVYKSGDQSTVNSHRLIFLLYVIYTSKVLESLVYSKIINLVLNNITTGQFGFLPAKSKTQKLLLYSNNICKATSEGHQTNSIYPDFH